MMVVLVIDECGIIVSFRVFVEGLFIPFDMDLVFLKMDSEA